MKPLTTQIVGSYVKPHWLANHARVHDLDGNWWRPQADFLDDACDDATLLAIYEQERAGLDIVTDGEIRRVHYDRHFLVGLGGVSLEHHASKTFTTDVTTSDRRTDLGDLWEAFKLSPTIIGPLTWQTSAALDDFRFLKRHARHAVKVSVVGPMTLYDRLIDAHYATPEQGIIAMAAVLNKELRVLQAEGAALLQIDEPAIHFKLTRAQQLAPAAMERMLDGITTPVVVHACYGYAMYSNSKAANPAYTDVVRLLASLPIQGMSLEYAQPGHTPDLLEHAGDKHVLLGLLDLGRKSAETAVEIANSLRDALRVVPAERLHPCSDCGMWYLPRALARAKITALVAGTDIVRRELGLPTFAP